jgi:hypothetical protein
MMASRRVRKTTKREGKLIARITNNRPESLNEKQALLAEIGELKTKNERLEAEWVQLKNTQSEADRQAQAALSRRVDLELVDFERSLGNRLAVFAAEALDGIAQFFINATVRILEWRESKLKAIAAQDPTLTDTGVES